MVGESCRRGRASAKWTETVVSVIKLPLTRLRNIAIWWLWLNLQVYITRLSNFLACMAKSQPKIPLTSSSKRRSTTHTVHSNNRRVSPSGLIPKSCGTRRNNNNLKALPWRGDTLLGQGISYTQSPDTYTSIVRCRDYRIVTYGDLRFLPFYCTKRGASIIRLGNQPAKFS